MTANGRPEGSEWVLQPPSGHIRFSITLSDEGKLSEEHRTSIEKLLDELHQEDVRGFAQDLFCPSLDDCRTYKCTLKACKPLTKEPCRVDVRCSIASFM